MHIALVEPEIPGNTGSIGRVCVGTATTLHLVGRLGFSLDEKYVRRAGLDYWKDVDLRVHADFDALVRALPAAPLHLFSAHAAVRYDQVAYGPDDVLVFGCETKGLPLALRQRFADRLRYVPTNGRIRSLNLANVATAVLFEALRQQDFAAVARRPDQGAASG
ncbi:MAG: tRNA (cytidine(34)-2'-O)-methyltransferase [Deltaproteobacteria bacterium]|nr:tRNA (cytidine(34)-2'-O)-methyltransferase [Deltaproteobacteria bacterium]